MYIKHRIIFCVCVVAFVSFASNSITKKKFAITNSFVSEHFWNSPPKCCGIHSLGVTALPSYYTTACFLLHSGVLVSDDAPGESRQKLSKLKAKLLSEAQVAARHQDARVDRRSQSGLYWTLGRTLTQQTDHEWRSKLANSTILQTRRLETVSFSTWTHSQVQGLCGGMMMNRSLVWWLTIEHCSSENDLH